jgi:hypothetical protein
LDAPAGELDLAVDDGIDRRDQLRAAAIADPLDRAFRGFDCVSGGLANGEANARADNHAANHLNGEGESGDDGL